MTSGTDNICEPLITFNLSERRAALSVFLLSQCRWSGASEESTGSLGNWSLEQDEALVLWWAAAPSDWQVGGQGGQVYMWGGGRYGQLAEAGRPPVDLAFYSASLSCNAIIHDTKMLWIINMAAALNSS